MRGIPVSDLVVHERFDRVWVENDIALVRLQFAVDLGSPGGAAGAACLPAAADDHDAYNGRSAVVSGWGTTSFSEAAGRVSRLSRVTPLPFQRAMRARSFGKPPSAFCRCPTPSA